MFAEGGPALRGLEGLGHVLPPHLVPVAGEVFKHLLAAGQGGLLQAAPSSRFSSSSSSMASRIGIVANAMGSEIDMACISWFGGGHTDPPASEAGLT